VGGVKASKRKDQNKDAFLGWRWNKHQTQASQIQTRKGQEAVTEKFADAYGQPLEKYVAQKRARKTWKLREWRKKWVCAVGGAVGAGVAAAAGI